MTLQYGLLLVCSQLFLNRIPSTSNKSDKVTLRKCKLASCPAKLYLHAANPEGTLCENQHKDGISQFTASTTTASLKNGFCLETDTGFNSLRDILIQDREDGNPPHETLNCTCTEEIKIQLNECKICASTLENILYLGPYSTNHIQTSYKNPLAYWVWEMTVNIVATTE